MKRSYLFILLLLGITVILLPLTKYLSDKHLKEIIYNQNQLSAAIVSDLLNKARQNYSHDALKKFQQLKPDVLSGHDYHQRDNMVPNPATFAIELADTITADKENIRIWMYSNYPFPWREKTAVPKNEIEKQALDFLTKNPQQIFIHSKGQEFFYASPISMSDDTCIDCHNNHPASLKTDWKKGDIRAILAVNINNKNQMASESFSTISYILYFLLLVCCGTIIYLLSSLNKLKLTTETANRDKLTGLYNRNYVSRYLMPKFYRAKNEKGQYHLALLLIDIDHFKAVNDQYGHNIGDQCLVEVTTIIQQQLRDSDIAVRWGGEEFLIFIPNISQKSLEEVSQRVRKAVNAQKVSEKELSTTVSIGACFVESSHKPEFAMVVKCADKALYQAKATGRDKVVISELN